MPATVLVSHQTETSLELVWGSTGRAQTVELTRSGSEWQLSGKLLLGRIKTWQYAMCPDETHLGPATFEFADHDRDGKLDLLIAGYQVSNICEDDYTMGHEGDVTLIGRPVPRAAKALGPASAIEPMHGVSIKLDKPMEQSATASLVPIAGGPSVQLTPTTEEQWVVGFSTKHVFAPGMAYTAEFSGNDFVGLAAPASIEVKLIDDFGVLAQDGFESGSTSGIWGAELVDSWHVPVISGARMLQVVPGKPAILHLQRTGSEQNVVLKARKYDDACFIPGWDGSFGISAGVVGASQTHGAALELGSSPETVALDGGSVLVGELQTITIAVPESGSDVLVYLLGEKYLGAGCAVAGAIVDDVLLQ